MTSGTQRSSSAVTGQAFNCPTDRALPALSAPGPLALDQRDTPCLLAAHCEFSAPGPLHFLCWEKLTDFILFSITTPPITSWQIDQETVETVTDYFGRLQNHCIVTAAMKLKDAYSLEEKL